MNMAISDLVRTEMRMRRGRQILNPVMLTSLVPGGGLHRRLALMGLAFLLGRTLSLVVIMIWRLICFNGRLLMGRGRLGLIRGWMGYGIIRVYLIRIHP